MKEIWKDIPEYKGWYQVSNHGQVKRIAEWPPFRKGRILKPKPVGRDRRYRNVFLSKKGKVKSFYIHRLVMLSFVGKCPTTHQVNHKDGDKTNNHLDNLEYLTPSQNQKHAMENGLMPGPPLLIGEKANRSKLTAEQVLKIRELYVPHKITFAMLSKIYDVSKHSIYMIIHRKSWKHI